MKNKKINIEKKIYELLGVRIFKKIVLLIPYSLIRLTHMKEPKSVIYSKMMKRATNYNIGSITDIEQVARFKKYLKSNALIHIAAELVVVFGVILSIITKTPIPVLNYAILTIINTYCIMLQRYNYIRFKPVLERYKDSKDELGEEIKSEDSKIKSHYYTCRYENNKKRSKDKTISLDSLINDLNLKELKSLKSYLIIIQNNFELYSMVQEIKEYPLELDNNKKLNLKLNKNN